METKRSLPCIQQPATCPYLEPVQSSPCPHPNSWRSTLILSSHPRWFLQEVSFPQVSSPKLCILLCFFSYVSNVPLSDSYRCECTNNIWWKAQITKLFVMQSFHYPVTSSLLGPNVFLRTLFSNTLSLRFSLNVSDHISHPYKKQAKL